MNEDDSYYHSLIIEISEKEEEIRLLNYKINEQEKTIQIMHYEYEDLLEDFKKMVDICKSLSVGRINMMDDKHRKESWFNNDR